MGLLSINVSRLLRDVLIRRALAEARREIAFLSKVADSHNFFLNLTGCRVLHFTWNGDGNQEKVRLLKRRYLYKGGSAGLNVYCITLPGKASRLVCFVRKLTSYAVHGRVTCSTTVAPHLVYYDRYVRDVVRATSTVSYKMP